MVYQIEYVFTDHESDESSNETKTLFWEDFDNPKDILNAFMNVVIYQSYINDGYDLNAMYADGSVVFHRINNGRSKLVYECSRFRVYEIREDGERIPCEI